jgi:iron complex transport system substrate-binding protein
MRVVSLLPSATELLATIPGGVELLVGRSHECDWPRGIERLPVLTAQRTDPAAAAHEIDAQVRAAMASRESLYVLNEPLLASLRPDLILTQDLCHVCSIDLAAVRSVVSRLTAADGAPPRVLSFNPETVEGVLDDLLTLGQATGLEAAATATLVSLRERLYRVQDYVNPFADGPTVAFLEWTDPLFVGGHWTPQLIERAGGFHPLNPTQPVEGSGAASGPQQAFRRAGKSIAIRSEILAATKPEYLIICPCGVPLEATRPPHYRGLSVEQMVEPLRRQAWFQGLPAVQRGRVALVDGSQMFNRPGPRLVDAFEWLVGWINDRPELIPAGFPWRTLD